MSCSLKQTCHIPDIGIVQKYLFGDDQGTLNQDQGDVDDDPWDEEKWVNSWGDEENETEEEMDSSENINQGWLRNCHIAFSPTYDLMALSHGDKLILLTAKSDSSVHRQKSRMKFNVSAKVEVAVEIGEHITSLLCIPLVSLKRTSHGSTDWSCVIVGFSSGHVRLYTETGALLVSQLFHESPVIEVKCKTHDLVGPRKHHRTSTEQNDEITVLYIDALVVLDGFSLFQTLRACRSQVALAAASGGKVIDPPPLSYKKWTFTGGQSHISSHVSSGILTENAFDQMRTASVRGGYSAEVRGAPPAMLCYVSMGSAPFTGFYFAVEGSSQPLLSHVALAVASKLKSALYNSATRWLSWGGQQEVQTQQKLKPKVELGSPLDIRSGLSDQLRRGNNIILSPDASLSSSALAATTDSLGRVMLLDLTRAIALRIWKGYRDAQIGFVRVFDDAHRSSRHKNKPSKISDVSSKPDPGICRHALFLLIYAPRRGLLEVWTCINGPRVGAFNVSKNARLLYPGHGMMGINSNTTSGSHSHMFQCCLVDENGNVQEVNVPFHLALSDSNSKKARDLHLLKKLNMLLHSKKKAGEEAVKLLLEIRISTMQRQALERLLHTKRLGVETFRNCITAIQQRLQEGGSISLMKEEQDLLAYCDMQMELISLYEAISKLNEGGNATEEKTTYDLEDVCNVDQISNLLHMTRSEAEEALKSIKSFRESCHKPKVRFESGDKKGSTFDIAEFLDFFVQESKLKKEEVSLLNKSKIHFRLTDQGKASKLANFLVHASLFGSTAPEDIIFSLERVFDVNVQTMLSLLLTHWLLQEEAITKNLANATEKLHIYVEAYSRRYHNEQREDNETFNLWEWIREDMLGPSHNVIAAYLLSLICRGIIISSQTQVAKDEGEMDEAEDPSNLGKDNWDGMLHDEEEAPPSYEDSCTGEKFKHREGGEWETLWIETEEWNLFVRQLEDSLLINTAINLGMEKSGNVRCLGDEKKTTSVMKDVEKSSFYKDVVNNQDESVFEKVGVRDLLMNGSGIIAELVSHSIRNLRIPPSCLKLAIDIEGMNDMNPQQKKFLDFLHSTLYPRFPYSLAPDCLHAHCFWDMMVCWNKDPLVISNMSTASKHLSLIRHDPHVRHGLAVMAWKTFVCKRFIALAKLIEKVGKAPKDRLCRKDVGISDTDMADFCQACTELLQTIADADLDMVPKSVEGLTEKQTQAIEDAWQGITGRQSIMDLARSHTIAHYGIVQHNMHLSFILQAIMQFSLRGIKPLSLFDHRGKSCFGMDLTNKDPDLPNMDNIDVGISKSRQKFLSKVVSAAVGELTSLEIAEYLTEAAKKTKFQKDDLEKWIETAVHMASEFQINVEQVLIHHIQELFSHGLDDLGNEACNSISDKDVLASCLVAIVGQRLSYLFLQASPDDGVVMLSQMPPTLSTWIKSQDYSLLNNPKVAVENTLALVRKILSMMSEQHSQYNLTLFLEEAASAITSP